MENSKYLIIGGGLAGASAVKGIREIDKNGTIRLLSDERHLPYDRPPLTKKLWFGKKKVEEIFLHDEAYYKDNGVILSLGVKALSIDAKAKKVADGKGNEYRYEKLLIATGGIPRKLPIPGGDLEGVCYYRYLDDYKKIREKAKEGSTAVVIGGGFIGSEIAAALNINKVNVTMIFPSEYIVDRVFPESLGMAIQREYEAKGVKIVPRAKPASFTKKDGKFLTTLEDGRTFESDMLIAGIGIAPSTELAASAGLKTGNGIEVNELLETSDPDIYAAGDNAFFPYKALGKSMRVEHWDNALTQGEYAGRNMAGAKVPYDHMPYFFSDLFEFGYEAVGEVSSSLETFADWQEENKKGVIYYLKDRKVRGVMLCNVWEKVDWARGLIKNGKEMAASDLRRAAG